jgi:coenzyme PQQ precursor peptide PqqA
MSWVSQQRERLWVPAPYAQLRIGPGTTKGYGSAHRATLAVWNAAHTPLAATAPQVPIDKRPCRNVSLRCPDDGRNFAGVRGARTVTWLEEHMAWKTPKIVEVPVGMEINMYACAARK